MVGVLFGVCSADGGKGKDGLKLILLLKSGKCVLWEAGTCGERQNGHFS